jgi:aminoglycoside 2'-N-acetyltransferase I
MDAIESMEHFTIKVVPGRFISTTLRRAVVELCSRAYEKDVGTILDTFLDATHLIGYYENSFVCHALWVSRYLHAGTNPMMRTAYVEAVATAAEYRKRGFASAIMKHLIGEIQDYDMAALSPAGAAFYERLGWELWRGPLFIRKNDNLISSIDDEEVMIFRLPKTPVLDIHAPLSAEWREGELW